MSSKDDPAKEPDERKLLLSVLVAGEKLDDATPSVPLTPAKDEPGRAYRKYAPRSSGDQRALQDHGAACDTRNHSQERCKRETHLTLLEPLAKDRETVLTCDRRETMLLHDSTLRDGCERPVKSARRGLRRDRKRDATPDRGIPGVLIVLGSPLPLRPP
jgi:hypothetical protein